MVNGCNNSFELASVTSASVSWESAHANVYFSQTRHEMDLKYKSNEKFSNLHTLKMIYQSNLK